MKKSNFIDGALIATVCIIITKVIGMLYVIPFYGIIGEKGGALYGYAYNIYNIFLIISSAGIPLAVSKITSEYIALEQYKEKNYLDTFVRKAVLIFSIISFCICFFGAELLANLILGDLSGGNTIQDVTLVIRAVSFALLVVPSLSILRGYLQGHKYIAPASISQVIEQLFRVLFILIGSYLCIYVFDLGIVIGVSVSVFSAVIGATFSYIYLYFKNKKIKKIKTKDDLSIEDKKAIKKKLISYCIPFITVSLSYQIYNSVDMILIIRVLNYLNFDPIDIEIISGIFTTWGNKLIAIVTAFATGIVISLIPNMVRAYAKKNITLVNDLYQKTIEVLLLVILPITLLLSIHSDAVWLVFYGQSYYGPIVFKFLSILGFFEASYVILGSINQNLGKNKLIYSTIITGLGINALLDVPLMLLFNHLKLYPFYGAITATIIGNGTALLINMIYLSKKDNILFKFKNIRNNFFLTLVLILPLNLLLRNLTLNVSNRISLFFIMAFIGLITLVVYVIINYNFIKDLLKKKRGK